MSRRRIGVTARLARPAGPDEPFDAWSRWWPRVLRAALPEALWAPVPNLGTDMPDYLGAWGIDALILTGGDGPGDDLVRDATEALLLDLAADRNWPVLGVCRGMQAIQRYCGGELVPVEGHVAVRHAVTGRATMVNSFHRFAIDELAPPLVVRARDAQGRVEAFGHSRLPWRGIMWHPEREPEPDPADIALLRDVFATEAKCA